MKKLVLAFMLLGMLPAVHAADPQPPEAIKSALAKVVNMPPDTIKPSQVPGLYEVTFGSEIYYITADGKFLINGEVHDIDRRINLTEQHRQRVRKELLAGIDEKSMIIYKPKGEVKHTITVFTDIDCGYCRKLHSGMAEMNDLGIEVRYMAFPRAGLNTPSYDKAVNVWCAKDPATALTDAKLDKPIPKATCDNPVQSEMLLGQKMGVTGTPAIVLDDGTLLPGYMAPKRLFQVLEAHGS